MKVFSKTLLVFLSYYRLLVLFLFVSSFNGYAQNIISIPFSSGFVGDINGNGASNAYYFSTLGWTNVQFTQQSTTGQFVGSAQGNDVPGVILITDYSGIEKSVTGFVQWRKTASDNTLAAGFTPASGTNVNLTTRTGTYSITATKTIGLIFNGQTLTISPEPGPVTGNASTSGLLSDFNTYLGTLPKISISDVIVGEGEGDGTATVTVSLSATSTNSITVNYATSDVSAIAGADYTAISGTLTFAPGESSKTITVNIADDSDLESFETFNVILTDAINAAIIDATSIIGITDNDAAIIVSGIADTFTACDGTVSAEQSFSVSGSGLTDSIVVVAPTGYEISLTSGSGFTNTLTLAQSGGTVASTTIYVRLKSDALNGASGNITFDSTGKTQRVITLSAAIVSPTSVAGSISGAGSVCSGTNSTTLTLSGNTGTIQWQSRTGANAFADISGETGTSYIATNLTTTTDYRAVVTSGSCASATTSAVTMTVSPTSVAGSISGAGSVCSGTNSTTLTLSGNTGTIQWQSRTGANAFADISGETGATYTATNLTTTTDYRAVVTSGSCASATTSAVTMTVSPTSVAGSISGAGSVCSGTNSKTLTLSGNTGTIQWQSRTGTNAFADISGETGTSYIATNLTTTTDYRAVVTSGSCASATTSVTTVTVNPLPAAEVYGVNTICDGNSIVLSADASNQDISYTALLSPETITSNTSSGWQSFTSGVDGNLTKVSFGFKNTSNTTSFIAKLNIYSGEGTAGTKLVSQYVTINQPTTGFVSQDFILNSPVALTANTVYTAELVASSTANKISFFNSDAASNPAGGTSNVNNSTDYYFTNEVIPLADSNLSFQWQVDTGSGFANVATNGTNQYIAPTTAGAYRVKITDTTTGCFNTSASKTVTVDAKPVANAGADTMICGSALVTYKLVNASATNVATIYWTSSGTGSFDSPTIEQPTYTPSSADIAAGSVNLTMIVGGTAACSSEIGFDQMKLSFGAAPTVDAGVDATFCSNASYTTTANATNGTSLWTTRTGDGVFNDPTLLNPVYTPGPNDIANGTVTLTLTVTGTEDACTSAKITDSVVLTITPAATASAGPNEVKVCTGLTYTATNAVATNYTAIVWTTSGTGDFDDKKIKQPTYTPSTADIASGSVLLTMSVSGNSSCNAISEIRLIFTPVPTSNAGGNAAICSDGTFTTTGIATGGTIIWTSTGNGTFDDAKSLNAVYTPGSTDAANSPITLKLTVSGTNECLNVNAEDEMQLTVSPVNTANAGSDTTICSNTTFQTQGQASNGTISWTTSGKGTFSDNTIAAPIYTPSSADKLAGSVTLTMEVQALSGTACEGRIETDTVNLTITPEPTVNAGPATAIICGGTTYQTQGTATNGDITWTTSGTGTFNNDAIATPIYTPGVNETSGTVTLTMTVKGQNGCSSDEPSDSVVLSIFTTTAVVTTIDVTCNGGNNGFASVAASGGTAPYSYAWSRGSTLLTPTGNELANLEAGNYSCVVTDVNGCSVTKTFTITEPSALTITSSHTNVTTNNGTDGTATVSVTGGTTPYTYSWSPTGGNTATASNLAAGTYTCTVTDAKGCFVTEQVTISEPTLFAVTTASTNVSCNGAANGTASVTATGGILPYTYLWSNGATTSSITGLAPNTYTCTITENNGTGIAIQKSFTITQPLTLTATTLPTNVGINGQNTGSATVSVSGGTAPYSYSWTNSSSTTATASNLVAGNYTCIITDSKGCTISKDFTITQPTVLVINSGVTTSTNVLCFGNATGSATVAVTGGVTPYIYSWSPNVSSGATANNLLAGTYVCTITDANGAKVIKSFTITQPNSVLSATTTSSAILCNGGTTTVSVSVSGGTPGYTYSWSPNGGNANSATLTAGSYICTITDLNGCQLTKNFTITQPAAALDATTTQTDVLVYGSSTGSATVNVTGGTAPYTYSWTNSLSTTSTASNLAAGSYTCTIKDANGCTLNMTFIISQASAITASVESTNVSCYAGNNGSASITSVSGGSGSYTYLWSPSGGTNAIATDLSAGTYTCYITDSNGAFITKTFNITQPTAALSVSISKVNPAINGTATGSATVTIAGGTSPYTYSWSNGTSIVATTATVTSMAAGTYTCTVTDLKGCSVIKTVVLTEPSSLLATTSKTDVSCYGGNNGTAGVSVSGGVSPYTYVWTPSVGVGATLNGLTAGTYICTVTDANGATVQKTIDILQPTALSTSVSQINVGCNGLASGSATVTVTGGTAPYTYSWSPSGGISSTASNLIAGNYSCIITDSKGCTVTRNITITQAPILSATTSKVDVKCNGDNTGSATVSVSGGNPTYTYLWSNGATTPIASNLAAGSYSCTITDANGCSLIKSFTINQPSVLSATTSQTNVVCYGQATGAATVSVTGGVSPYTYLWSPAGGKTNSANNLTAGNYTCTITDANNCVLVKTFTITESALIPIPTSDAGPDTASICAGSTYSTGGLATGGTVLWTSNGSGTFDNPALANAVYTPSAADKATGVVTLTMKVTPPGSCGVPVATDRVLLTIYPVSAGGIVTGASTVCTSINNTTLKLSEYTGNIQWQLSTDNNTFVNIPGANSATYDASNLTTTTYYKAVVTSGVCSSSESSVATITVTHSSVAGVISGSTSVCSGTNSTTLSLTGNVGTIQWQSSSDNLTFNSIVGATSSSYTAANLTATKYYRVAVNNNVCSVSYSTSAAVIVNPVPVADAGPATTIICAGSSFTATATALNGTASWSVVSGSGTFVNPSVTNAVYVPSASDIVKGSVTLKMTVTGSFAGCGTNSASDNIVITINSPAAPTVDAIQNICYVGTPKVIDLKTTLGTAVKWYATATGGTPLDPNTDLVSGNTYYATQTLSGCESITRTAVYVNLTCAVTAVKDNLGPINGYTGGTTTSVLNNDLLNGTYVIPSEITLSGVTIPTGFILNPNGTVKVPAGTPSGVYKLTYKICEVANPSNCSQVESDIVVGTTSIIAVQDEYGPINGVKGATTLSVLNNDYLNGVILSPLEVNLTTVVNTTTLVLNANGTITIPPGTPSGIYELKYKITEKLNLTNTSQVIAVITVGACLDFPINDCDGDGVTNGQELIDATDPSDSCSLKFLNQNVAASTVWINSDCDGDGVKNGQEVIDGTNPVDMCAFKLASVTVATLPIWNNSDCDGDGVKNGQEILDGTNPSDICSYNALHISGTTSSTWNDLDCDGDGVKNKQEILDGTNPVDFCSFKPNHITAVTSAQWKAADCDGDGVTNNQEILDGTDPTDSCKFITAHQTLTTSTIWNNLDCDGDGVVNRKEILDGTNPLDVCSFVLAHQTVQTTAAWKQSDCDGDGVVNSREIADNTDPSDPCSLMVTSQTVATSTNWKNLDCDGDGVTNGQEITDGTDVNNYCSSVAAHVSLELSQEFLDADCDGDGLINGEEIGPNPKQPFDFNGNGIPDYLEMNSQSKSEDNLEIFKSLTPNGNGENDVFVIRNINLYPNNTVTVFNRWGVVVYEEDGYGSNEKFFRGYSDGKCTMRKGVELPNGTYFYQVRYTNHEGAKKSRTGYLFINR